MEKDELNSKLRTIKINHEFSKFKSKLKKDIVIVQSLLFPKEKFDVSSAKKWAIKKGYKIDNVDVPKKGEFIHFTQNKEKFNTFSTKILADGVKARIATNSSSKFAGHMKLSGFSKFSDKIKNDNDLKMPLPVEFYILCEGENRDGVIRREDLEESLELWNNLPIIDFHDKSDKPTEHKISDEKGYTFGKPYLKFKEGKMWIVAPGEIINRDMAYQAYIRSMRGKALEVSAEFGWNKYVMDGTTYQTSIKPQLISIVDKGHLEGNKMAIMAS